MKHTCHIPGNDGDLCNGCKPSKPGKPAKPSGAPATKAELEAVLHGILFELVHGNLKGNPYCSKSVMAALRLLGRDQGIDWADVNPEELVEA